MSSCLELCDFVVVVLEIVSIGDYNQKVNADIYSCSASSNFADDRDCCTNFYFLFDMTRIPLVPSLLALSMPCRACIRGYSTSSKRWVARQRGDVFTREAKVQQFKSRAAFKLLEASPSPSHTNAS